jgi:hypothetical protein
MTRKGQIFKKFSDEDKIKVIMGCVNSLGAYS